ncbi:MAG: hypothetical protein QW059_00130 [Nitrososphaerota archaeon]
MQKKVWYIAIVAITAIIGSLVLVLTQPLSPLMAGTTTKEVTTTQTTGGQARIVTFTLYLSDYGFNSSKGGPTLTVNAGDHIRITLIGNGSGPVIHDFALDENSPSPYNVKSDRLSRGETQVIEFIAEHPGTFKYYCSVSPPFGQSHRERGMEATIIVTER